MAKKQNGVKQSNGANRSRLHRDFVAKSSEQQNQGRKNNGERSYSKYSGTPYNFVPLWEAVYSRYSAVKELPSHGKWAPGRLSGSISCTFTAETPVCVSDGQGGFFRDAEGNYVLPGSTIKGLVRTNMMILGFGALRPGEDLDDVRMLYRAFADAKTSVNAELKEDYVDALGCRNDNPPRVSACYVRREGKEYEIYRAETFYRVKRTVPPSYDELGVRRSGKGKVPNPALKQLERAWVEDDTQENPVWYRLDRQEVREVRPRRDGNAPVGGWKAGILLSPGKMHGQNTLYLFPAFDAQADHFRWSREDRLAYEVDYKRRVNSLGGTDSADEKTKERRKNFWKLPEEEGQVKACFLLGKFEEALGEVSTGGGYDVERKNAVILGRSPYLRLGFRYTPSHGLPLQHREAAERLTLDYPYALLGFSSQVDEQGEKKNLAYRSRVSFEDFPADRKNTGSFGRVLAEPKPTSFPDYVEGGKSYNEEQFRLRGIKQYWLHEVNNGPAGEEKENVTSKLTTLLAGTRFTGRVRFHNLSEDELGLLLWCLRLDEGCFQTVGKGKPYGLGRMSVAIHRVERLCPERLYSPESLTGAVTEKLNPEELMAAYERQIQSWLNSSTEEPAKKKQKKRKQTLLRERKSIADFLYLHSSIREEKTVRYMDLDGYSNRLEGLKTVRDLREEAAKAEHTTIDPSLSPEHRQLIEQYRSAVTTEDPKVQLYQLQFKLNGWPIPED